MMSTANRAKEHFDSIAENYREELPKHIRDHLNAKWWALVSDYFPRDAKAIDLGCGDGTNLAFLRTKRVSCVGIDLSPQQIRWGKKRYPELQDLLFEGDMLALDYPDATFDVATITGVLHHIYSRTDQEKAIREALRVLREGGVLIVRESNLINPLFRVFWNYVFPLTAKIDRFGGEHWIPARYAKRFFREEVERVRFFTFIPPFTPFPLMRLVAPLERIVERSPLGPLSAHYVAVLRKGGRVSRP